MHKYGFFSHSFKASNFLDFGGKFSMAGVGRHSIINSYETLVYVPVRIDLDLLCIYLDLLCVGHLDH